MKFLIQTENRFGKEIPAFDFCYSFIDAIDYINWYNREEIHSVIYSKTPSNIFCEKECVPIGSVEFTIAYYKNLGIKNIKPLNIPKNLWHFCNREIFISNSLPKSEKVFFVKDTETIKSHSNDFVNMKEGYNGKNKFFSEFVDDIVSEWRLFVFRESIKGYRCYLGDNFILPDKLYCEKVVKEYKELPAYTLDVMISKSGNKYTTEILELHDFFSCGLYGFDDPCIVNMAIASHNYKLSICQ